MSNPDYPNVLGLTETVCLLTVGFHKTSIPPNGWFLKILRRYGSQTPKFLKESMQLNWNLQRGEGVQTKKPSVGEMWIFSGTTHLEYKMIFMQCKSNNTLG